MRKPNERGAALPTRTPRALKRAKEIISQSKPSGGLLRGKPVCEVPEVGPHAVHLLPDVREVMAENSRLRANAVALKIENKRLADALDRAGGESLS